MTIITRRAALAGFASLSATGAAGAANLQTLPALETPTAHNRLKHHLLMAAIALEELKEELPGYNLGVACAMICNEKQGHGS